MKSRHCIVVKPQIKLSAEGDVMFLALSTNLARMGVRAGQMLTQEKFCAKFCDVKPGGALRFRWVGRRPNGRWIMLGNGVELHNSDQFFTVLSVRLQRLNEMTDEDRAREEFGTTGIADREDNPFLFVLELQPTKP